LCGDLGHRDALAGLPAPRAVPGDPRLPEARPPLRRDRRDGIGPLGTGRHGPAGRARHVLTWPSPDEILVSPGPRHEMSSSMDLRAGAGETAARAAGTEGTLPRTGAGPSAIPARPSA